MSHRFAVFAAGSVNSVEEANDLVHAMAAGDGGEWPAAIQELVDGLGDSAEMACLAEHPLDSRGVVITTSSPEDGPLRYLLGLTMASRLAVYDIELFRLYDPRGCVEVDVSLGGTDTLPYLTSALLRDLVLRPTWPSPDEPFLIVGRDQGFIQVFREEDGTYQIEYREGGPDTHFWCRITDSGLIADVMWAWASQDLRWRVDVAWSHVRHVEEDEEDEEDDTDSWQPTSRRIHVDENSDRELGFDDTEGEPFLAYHAGNPGNDKDAEGRLIPVGWVLHVLDEEPFVTGVVAFDGVDEALAAAHEYAATAGPGGDPLPEPDGHTAVGAVGTMEHGFPVRYVSDQDGVRWLTIGPADADMTGWSVEVGPDPDWYRQRGLVPPDGVHTEIEAFRRVSLWGIGERWCVPIDWGERGVRWMPSDDEESPRRRVIATHPTAQAVRPVGPTFDDEPRAEGIGEHLLSEEDGINIIEPATTELRARYEAAHAKIMAGDWANLQADIDSGAVWSMGEGAVALAMKMLTVGAVMAPSVPTKHPEGPAIPVVWGLDGENGRGSIQGAEAYIANEEVLH